jgi:hypothetical protein
MRFSAQFLPDRFALGLSSVPEETTPCIAIAATPAHN